MSQNLENLVKRAQEELHVSQEAASAYKKAKEILLHMVNEKLTGHPHLAELLGSSPLQMMYDNQHNHLNLMINVLKLNGFEILTRMVPWVYRTYQMRGFSYEYFPEELRAWQGAVERVLDKKSAEEIIPVYEWLLKNHEVMISLSKEISLFRSQVSPEWQRAKEQFLHHLLNGDFDFCLRMSRRMVRSKEDLKSFYLEVVQPSLYDIGALWEEGQISVAEEHLATAIVGRIMANIYAGIPRNTKSKEKIVLTTTPNEFHEIGCRMTADLLEAEGWNVLYLGANTPQKELLKLLKRVKPKILGISVTMVFNLLQVEEIITSLREDEDLRETKVMVGGITFNFSPNLWQKLKAHGWAADGKTAIALVERWMEEV